MRRFPGPEPYSDENDILFFGRDDEKRQLSSLVQKNRLTVLFGRSGYGKSSLIKAGVVGNYRNNLHYYVIEHRFLPLSTGTFRSQLREKLRSELGESGQILMQEIGSDEGLWQLYKSLQWKAQKEGHSGVLLILDQFEEVFAVDDKAEYLTLTADLAHLIFNKIPEGFQAALDRKLYGPPGPNGELEKTDFYKSHLKEIEFLNADFAGNVLIGIRSDRLYLLEELGEILPNVFSSRYQLQALTASKVGTIVQTAGMKDGTFDSPKLNFDNTTVQMIKEFLVGARKATIGNEAKDSATAGKWIDNEIVQAFELQIICEYVERKAVTLLDDGKCKRESVLEVKDLLPEKLSDVLKNYYAQILMDARRATTRGGFDEHERLVIRYLVERKLINERNNRIPVDKLSIQPLVISDDLLERIVKTGIVRKDQNTASGQSYEISHDTLVAPIRASEKELGNLDNLLSNFYELHRKALQEFGIKDKNLVGLTGNLMTIKSADLQIKPGALIRDCILYAPSLEAQDEFVLNEAFQGVVKKKIDRSKQLVSENFKKGLVAGVILIITTVALLMIAIKRSEPETAFRIASENHVVRKLISKDSVDSARISLVIFREAYSKTCGSPFSRLPAQKFVAQFNALLPFAVRRGLKDQAVDKWIRSGDGKMLGILFRKKNEFPETQDSSEYSLSPTIRPPESLSLRLFSGSDTIPYRILGAVDAEYVSDKLVVLQKRKLLVFSSSNPHIVNLQKNYYKISRTALISSSTLLVILEEREKGVSRQFRSFDRPMLINLNNGTRVLLDKYSPDGYSIYYTESQLLVAWSDPNNVFRLGYHQYNLAGKRNEIGADRFDDFPELGAIQPDSLGIPVGSYKYDFTSNRLDYRLSLYQIDELVTHKNPGIVIVPASSRIRFGRKPRLTVIGTDTTIIYDSKLKKIEFLSIKSNYQSTVKAYRYSSSFKWLHFKRGSGELSDTIHVENDDKDVIITTSHMLDAWLSQTTDTTYVLQSAGSQSNLLLFDNKANILMQLENIDLPPTNYGDEYTFNHLVVKRDSLYDVDIKNAGLLKGLDNTSPASIARWLGGDLEKWIPAERLRKARQANQMEGWKNLFNGPKSENKCQ